MLPAGPRRSKRISNVFSPLQVPDILLDHWSRAERLIAPLRYPAGNLTTRSLATRRRAGMNEPTPRPDDWAPQPQQDPDDWAPQPQQDPQPWSPPSAAPPQQGPQPWGPPQPPYGEVPAPFGLVPPVAAPPPPNRRPLIIGIVAAAAVIIAVVVAVVLAAGGSSGSPKDVAQAFIDAAKRGDVAAAKDLVCARLADQVSGTDNPLAKFPATVTAEVTDVTEQGDTATATVKVNMSGPNGLSLSMPIRLPMVREHGDWKVCL
jgi:hypothetical protein